MPSALILFLTATIYGQMLEDSTIAVMKRQLVKTHKTRVSVFPYVFYTPETEIALGVGGIITFYTSKYYLLRPSQVTVSGYYSTRKQYKVTLWPKFYFARNDIFLSANFNFGGYVDKFWGIGNNTPDIDNEDYDANAFGMEISFEFPPFWIKRFKHKTGIIYDYNNYSITNKRSNPFLQDDEIVGSDGGISSGIGLGMIWDSRDNIFYPSKGAYIKLKALFYMKTFASDYDFNWYVADIRKYIGLKNQQIIAFQFYGSFVSDGTPFYELPLLGGGQIMRGYFLGRYRDRLYVAGQTEYRRHLWRRFGIVAFAGIGDVSERFRDFKIRELKSSIGFGLRFLFNKEENVNIRMDIGFGRDTNGVYFGVEEAF